MELERNTWCPKCGRSDVQRVERVVRTAQGWPKMFLISYGCGGCGRETVTEIKLGKKARKRARGTF